MHASVEPPICYRSWHVVVAALMGAIANSLAYHALVADRGDWDDFYSGVIFYFAVGLPFIALVGLPVARRAARRGRDTVLNGFIYGAVAGSLVGAALALLIVGAIVVSDLDLEKLRALWRVGPSMIVVLLGYGFIGVAFGVLNGAAAGATLAWCSSIGRRAQ